MDYAITILECEKHKLLERMRDIDRNEDALQVDFPEARKSVQHKIAEISAAIEKLKGNDDVCGDAKKLGNMLDALLNKVNRVTSAFLHGKPVMAEIPALCDRQHEIENEMEKMSL